MRAVSTIASGTRHVVGVGLQALLIVAIIAALTVATAFVVGGHPAGGTSVFAGKSQTSWIELAQGAGATATTQPSLGSSVAFLSGYPTNVKNPRIEVLCYQGADLVYGEAGSVDHTFLLGGASSDWLRVGGAAACTANLFYFGSHAGHQTYNRLATTSFSAGG